MNGLIAQPVFQAYDLPWFTPEVSGMAASPGGRIWFTMTDRNSIGVREPSGEFTEYPVPSAYSGPYDIVLGKDDALWFSEALPSGARIGRISIKTREITEFDITEGGSAPKLLALGPDGSIWFTEPDVGKVGRLDASGSMTHWMVPRPLSHPWGITVTPSGAVWFSLEGASTPTLGLLAPTTGSVVFFTLPRSGTSPAYLCIGPDGEAWFSEQDGGAAGRITVGGTITEFPLGPDAGNMYKIESGHDGNLWILNRGRGLIRLSQDGTARSFRWQAPAMAMTIAPDGDLWFATATGQLVRLLLSSTPVTLQRFTAD